MHVREIKTEARERFALNRYHAMLVYGVVYTLALNIAVLTTALALLNIWAIWYGVVLIFLFLLMLAPFGFGMTGFYIKLYRGERSDAFHVFDGFNKYNLERVIILRLLKTALWLAFTLLLIVPGIVFSIRTSMATYLLRANPKLKPKDALRASNRVMKKHCGKYFALVLSFTGWFAMCLLTCGLGFIWMLPYFNSAKMVFYKRELQGDTASYGASSADSDSVENGREEDCGEDAAEAVLLPGPVEVREETTEAVCEESVESEYNEPTSVDTVERVPKPEETEVPLRRERVAPLPGGRVRVDANGDRYIARERVRPVTETANVVARSERIASSRDRQKNESVRERLERIRAERSSLHGGTAARDRNDNDTKTDVEISED